LILGDFNMMELRAAAAVSGDPTMTDDFANGIDLHRQQAAAMLNIPYDEVDSTARDRAKPINFSMIYGAGAAGIVATAWNNYGIELSLAEAEAARQTSLRRYSTYADWMRLNYAQSTQRGMIKIGRLGRVIEAAWEAKKIGTRSGGNWWGDDAGDMDEDWGEEYGEQYGGGWTNGYSWADESSLRYTLCCNAPIQGACADAAMLALIKVDTALREAGIAGGPVLFVHDEIVLEVRKEDADAASRILTDCMTAAFAETFLGAPLEGVVTVKVGDSWGSSPGHAVLAPSAAERWIACPGSHQAARSVPPAPSSEFSVLGTDAHEWFAGGLRDGLAAEVLTDDPMLQRPLTAALDAARQILGDRPFKVESRLPPLDRLAEMWGTADVVGFAPTGEVDTIIDLKFGEAIAVEADTVQLGIYALLAARRYGAGPEGVTTWIIQPRHDHEDGLARSHRYGPAALDHLEAQLRDAAAAALTADAPRRAGEWCRFCPAAATCPERQAAPDAVTSTVSAWFRPSPRWLHST
jgi:hypothetical protein